MRPTGAAPVYILSLNGYHGIFLHEADSNFAAKPSFDESALFSAVRARE